MNQRRLMLGNEAMALGLVENGCRIATSYPGTPASEILKAVAELKKQHDLPMHVQWAINEKVAFEIAYAGCQAGLRTAVSMKQVGLNVASDPLMSSAYMGTAEGGGFVIISADDPGPHSSQTEQDSRLMAMMAKIPVLDPDSPEQARQLVGKAFELSTQYRIPVMIRPTTRVCHARQDIGFDPIVPDQRQPRFEKDPTRWAATPKFRFKLHHELEEKLSRISNHTVTVPFPINPGVNTSKAIVVSGVAAAHTKEILADLGLMEAVTTYQVIQPFPLHNAFMDSIFHMHDQILVIEETMPVIEMQLGNRHKVAGRMTHQVPRVGELLPETIEQIIAEYVGVKPVSRLPEPTAGRRPTLCAGCPHRAAFFAIRKVAKKGIYTSDIGCYTLGMNLGAVDTVLCMGAAISQAAGFYHTFKKTEKVPDIVATIGDSTFFHAGVPALIDAVTQKVKFVLVILDNHTTAMTGNQPTPASGIGACGEPLNRVDIPSLVRGCGVKFCKSADPYDMEGFILLLKEALEFCREHGPAVVISEHPCLIAQRHHIDASQAKTVTVTDDCDGCGFCLDRFECPAMAMDPDEKRSKIDPVLCSGCGVCIHVCPKQAIRG